MAKMSASTASLVSTSAPVTGTSAPSIRSIGGRPTCRWRSDAFFLITSSRRTSTRGWLCIASFPLIYLGCGNAVHFVQCCQPAQCLQVAVLAHGNHTLPLRQLLDGCRGGAF